MIPIQEKRTVQTFEVFPGRKARRIHKSFPEMEGYPATEPSTLLVHEETRAVSNKAARSGDGTLTQHLGHLLLSR